VCQEAPIKSSTKAEEKMAEKYISKSRSNSRQNSLWQQESIPIESQNKRTALWATPPH